MQGTIQSTQDNIKVPYKTTNGEFFVHGVTINGVSYETHQKKQTNKLKVGEIVEFDIKTDAKGNQKISIKTPSSPGGISYPPKAQEPVNNGQNLLPIPQKQPITIPVLSTDTKIWLALFQAVATFKQGVPDVKTAELADAADALLKRVPR